MNYSNQFKNNLVKYEAHGSSDRNTRQPVLYIAGFVNEHYFNFNITWNLSFHTLYVLYAFSRFRMTLDSSRS